MSNSGWEGWDLDGTISVYTKGDYNSFVVGPPIPGTVAILKRHLAEGKTCKIFTARVNPKTETPERLEKVKAAIRNWCREHIGQELELTCEKDYHMYALYDDRAIQVYPNQGILLQDQLKKTLGLLVNATMHPITDGFYDSPEPITYKVTCQEN